MKSRVLSVLLLGILVIGMTGCKQMSYMPSESVQSESTMTLMTPSVQESSMKKESGMETLFDPQTVLPVNAVVKQVVTADFFGDGKTSTILFYEVNAKQYLEVYSSQDGEWVKAKSDEGVNDSTLGYLMITKVEVIDLALDGKQELLVTKCQGKCFGARYYLFGSTGTKLGELYIQKGYSYPETYLLSGDSSLELTDVKFRDGKLVEQYDVYCTAKPNTTANHGSDEAVCRKVEVIQSLLSNGKIKPEQTLNKTI